MSKKAIIVDVKVDKRKNTGHDLITLRWDAIVGIVRNIDGTASVLLNISGALLITSEEYESLEARWASWLNDA